MTTLDEDLAESGHPDLESLIHSATTNGATLMFEAMSAAIDAAFDEKAINYTAMIWLKSRAVSALRSVSDLPGRVA